MAYTTLTRYLKLKVDSDLSADAVYNLQRIDALASTFVIDATEKLKIQSKGNIEIEPNDLALGGTGSGGAVEIGTTQHSNIDFKAYTASFKVDSGIETKNQTATKTNYLKLVFASDNSDARVLTFDLGSADRSIAFDHTGKKTAVVKDDSGNVTVAGTVTAPTFAGDLTGNADTATDLATGSILDIGKGGTGATTKEAAQVNLLPSYSSNANKVLGLNSTGDGLEWKAAGSGVVETISVEGPLTIDNTTPSLPEIAIDKADASTDGYLSSTDWNDFYGKQDEIPLATEGDYYRGDKTWATLNKSAVGLGNVDNTSDVNKPISSATQDALDDLQDALDLKYDASNPASYVDAADAKSAAVTNDIDDLDQTLAPDCAAVKDYVTANSGPSYSTTWTVADGNSKTVTHSLGTRSVSVTMYDENYETVYVDTEVRTDVNTVTLTRVGTATGTWTVIVKKL